MTTALAAQRQQLLRRLGHGRLVERRQHLAVGIHALGALRARYSRSISGTEGAAQAVGLRPRAPAELEHVAEAPGGDQPDLGDLALEQRVGGGRRAVHDRPAAVAGSTPAAASAARTPIAWLSTVVGTLASLTSPVRVIDRQQVGEGAADIDADDAADVARAEP